MTALFSTILAVYTAIRSWVVPRSSNKKRKLPVPPWRPLGYGARVLVVDLETTIDTSQRILFGFFRLYEQARLVREGIITADVLDYESIIAIQEYRAKARLEVFSRERFVEDIFYPEVYILGTLCVGYHISFDLVRLGIHAGVGRGKHRRNFEWFSLGDCAGTTCVLKLYRDARPSLASFPSVSFTPGSVRFSRVASSISARLAAPSVGPGTLCAPPASRFEPLRSK